jgi:hypothetical protein
MSKSKIYYAPIAQAEDRDWSVIYPEPQTLWERKSEQHIKIQDKQSDFFYCPAFSDFAKSTVVLTNPMRTNVPIVQNNSFAKVESVIPVYQTRDSCLKDHQTLKYNLQWIFFAEDDNVDITLTSPYMDNAPHTLSGSIVPGRFNISDWFRPINLEYNFYPGAKNFTVEEDEALAYVSFNTNKPIQLQRFDLTPELYDIALTLASGTSWESWVPLAKRYKRFKQARLKDSILRRIKGTLYDS